MDQATDLPALLPDGVLADVLGRLAQRDLTVSRSVCRAWRAVVDDHGMLRAELLPLSLAGLLINYNGSYYTITEFFARPSRKTKKKGPRVSGGKRDFLADGEIGSWSLVLDHCNGLLLIEGYECDSDGRRVLHALNPATRCRARVPRPGAVMPAAAHRDDRDLPRRVPRLRSCRLAALPGLFVPLFCDSGRPQFRR